MKFIFVSILFSVMLQTSVVHTLDNIDTVKYFYELTPKDTVAITCDLKYEMRAKEEKAAIKEFGIYCGVFKNERRAKIYCKNKKGKDQKAYIKISGAFLLQEKKDVEQTQIKNIEKCEL